jgi:hypothetical protein
MSLVTQEWLKNTTVRRCILVEVNAWTPGVAEFPIYMSTTGYITTTSDVFYAPIIKGGLKFTESLPSDSNPSSSYGDIEIYNNNGERDAWLDDSQYVFVNREVRIYYGDPTWITTNETQVESDFELIFTGVIVDIDTRSRDSIHLMVSDKMELLNYPVTEHKLGIYGAWDGGQTNQDEIIPLIFGEVHNVEPLYANPATLEYMFNDGAAEGIVEIRDNGVPVYTRTTLTTGATVDNTTGKFTLIATPAGQITVSVQGVKKSINLTNGSLIDGTYNNNIANLIALLVTQYGNLNTNIDANDLDLPQLSAFAAANTQYVGVPVKEDTLVNVCQTLASSIGATLFFTRQGKLQLLRYGIPTSDPSVNITENDIIHQSLSISYRSPILASTKIGYAKNWTVQENLQSSIPQEHKDLFATEWLTFTIVDDPTVTKYKLKEDPVQKDTMLIEGTPAETEATRLNTFYKERHTTYRFTGTNNLFTLKLGQPVQLFHSRFDLNNDGTGTTCQVVGLSPDWSKGLIDVEVLTI